MAYDMAWWPTVAAAVAAACGASKGGSGAILFLIVVVILLLFTRPPCQHRPSPFCRPLLFSNAATRLPSMRNGWLLFALVRGSTRQVFQNRKKGLKFHVSHCFDSRESKSLFTSLPPHNRADGGNVAGKGEQTTQQPTIDFRRR